MFNCFREYFHKYLLCQKIDVVDHKYTQRSTCRSKVYQRIQIVVYTILFYHLLYLAAAFYHMYGSSLLKQWCCSLKQEKWRFLHDIFSVKLSYHSLDKRNNKYYKYCQLVLTSLILSTYAKTTTKAAHHTVIALSVCMIYILRNEFLCKYLIRTLH